MLIDNNWRKFRKKVLLSVGLLIFMSLFCPTLVWGSAETPMSDCSIPYIPAESAAPESSEPAYYADAPITPDNISIRETTADFYVLGITAWSVVGIVFLGALLIVLNNPAYRPPSSSRSLKIIGNPKDTSISKKAVHGAFIMKSPQQMRRYNSHTKRRQ